MGSFQWAWRRSSLSILLQSLLCFRWMRRFLKKNILVIDVKIFSFSSVLLFFKFFFFFLLHLGLFFCYFFFVSVESAKALDAALKSFFICTYLGRFKCLLGLKPKRELIKLKPVGHLNRRFISAQSFPFSGGNDRIFRQKRSPQAKVAHRVAQLEAAKRSGLRPNG